MKIRTIYGRRNMKVVRAFNEWKGRVEYDVLIYDGVFSDSWISAARLSSEKEMSRKMADILYNKYLNPTK